MGDRLSGGVVVTKYGHKQKNLSKIEIIEAGHPIPDENGIKGVNKILALLKDIKRGDLIFILLSEAPHHFCLCLPAIYLLMTKIITDLLLKSGATIDETNAVRKHLSRLKGGQLASLLYPAESICLIPSDVIGDRLDVIASGLTVPDASTFRDAVDVLKDIQYGTIYQGL